MRIEYIIITIILFLVVLLSVVMFSKDAVPTFNTFVDNVFGVIGK